MNKNKIDLKRQNGSLWHLVRMSFVIVCCFVITSCFPGDQSQQSGSVEEFMRQQQSTAVSYSRSFQNYSALSQQALAKEIWETGSEVGIDANGLIDMSQFGAQYNVGNSDGYLQSAYCDNGGGDEYHLTWFKGANDPDTGAMEPIDLKGLGTTGYSAILKTLAKEMSPSAYGTYDNQNQVLSPIKGTQIAMNCPAAQFIPVGAPVIFTPIEQVNFRGNEEYYEYQDIACADPDDIGKIRQRRVVARIMDANGNVIGEESKGWEDFISTCQAEPSVPSISADVSGTASVVNFADRNLGTADEPCFEATIIREDNGDNRPPGQGEPGDNGQITETISNCDDGGTVGSIELPPGQSLVCGATAIRTENQAVPCSGSNWGGTAEYEQEIYECEIYQDGVPTGNFYEQRMEWALSSVNCTRPETTYFDCPTGAGQFTYTRTNTITNPVLPLTPDNPDWNYLAGSCDEPGVKIRACHDRYIGNSQVIRPVIGGSVAITGITNPHQILPANRTSISSLCGVGTQCTEYDDTLLCPVANMNGDREEERTYTCTGSNSGSWSDWTETTNDCACTVWTSGAEDISCYNSTPNNCFGSAGSTCATAGDTCIQATDLDYPSWYDDQVCAVSPGTGEAYNVQTLTCTEYTDEASCTACNEFETETRTEACAAPHSGDRTLERSKVCPSGLWTDWVEVSNSCTCGNPQYDTRTVACGPGQSGTKTQQAIRDDATCGYGPYTDLDTSQCVNVCTPANPPNYQWTGTSVTQGCVDLGDSGDGVCNAANVGNVMVRTNYEDSPAPGTLGCQDGSGPSGPYSYYHYLTITSVCEPYTGCVSCPTEGEVQTRNEEQACMGANELGFETRTASRTCTDVGGSLYWSDWQETAWDDSGCETCVNQAIWDFLGMTSPGGTIAECSGGTMPTGDCAGDVGNVCFVSRDGPPDDHGNIPTITTYHECRMVCIAP